MIEIILFVGFAILLGRGLAEFHKTPIKSYHWRIK